jgi:alpha-tubulin suppressor-like RCC1 family protein
VQVASSNSTQYALLANGRVYAWGLGEDGQLGDGTATTSSTTAVQVQFPAGIKIATLATDAMPWNTGLAIDTKGHAWGWGYSADLCVNKPSSKELVPVELPFSDVTALAGGGDHGLYDAGGTVYACGANHYGDLGDGSTTPSLKPVKVTGLAGKNVTGLFASYNSSGALLSNGTYFDWGYNGAGQLGDGTIGAASSVPMHVALPLPVTQVALGGSYAGNGQTLVLLSDGSLRAWGDDAYGQLGDGQTTNEASPIDITTPSGVTYAHLASGGGTSYALSTTGDVYCWGNNSDGQIGNGERSVQLIPQLIESGASLISSTALDVVTN